MRSTINQLIQLQELTLIRDEQRSIRGPAADTSALNASIEAMAESLVPVAKTIYARLSKKDHIVTAQMIDGRCSMCGMRLAISQVQSVKLCRELVTCPSCARVLYDADGARWVAARPKRSAGEPKVGVARFSAPELMVPELRARTAQDAIGELARTLQKAGFVDDAKKLVEPALAREETCPTGVGPALAFPHVRGIEGGGLSLALGAFLVGIIGSTSDVRERLAALVDPLKSMFAATFFVSIGLLVDPSALWASKTAILVVSLVVVVGKLFNITFASLLAGVDVRTSVQNGFALAQIGEFAFMVAILYAGIVNDTSIPMFQIAIGASLLTTLLNPWMIRLSGPAGDLAERLVPERFRVFLDAYRAWLAKIGASEGSPAFRRLKFAAIRLGVYAVLMFAVASACTLLYRIDYAGLSEFFERHDQIFFFCLANLFCVLMLPLWTGSARPLADSVTELLCGEGTARWQSAIQPLVRFVAFAAVFVLFLAEWGAIAVSIAPAKGPSLWIGIAVIVLVGAFGWRRMVKAGHRASKRLHEALTAEERREGLKRTMTVTIPEGTISEVVIPATSPAIGGTVVTLNVRAKTGASVVSVVRGGKTTRNIGPEWEFRAGDRIVALGDHKQIAALKDLMGVTV